MPRQTPSQLASISASQRYTESVGNQRSRPESAVGVECSIHCNTWGRGEGREAKGGNWELQRRDDHHLPPATDTNRLPGADCERRRAAVTAVRR